VIGRPRLARPPSPRSRGGRLVKTARLDPANRPAGSPLLGVERRYRDAIRRARKGVADTADWAMIRRLLRQGNIPSVVDGFDLAGFVEDYRDEAFGPMEEEVDRSGAVAAAGIGAAAAATVEWRRRRDRTRQWVEMDLEQAAERARRTAEEGLREAARRWTRAEVQPPVDAAVETMVESFGLGEREAGSAMQRLTAAFSEAETDADRKRAQDRAIAHARQLADYAAERDARTKIMEATNLGREQAIAQAIEDGVLAADARKVWLTEADPCEVCEELAGEVVPWDGSFSTGVARPPQHPNCRCWIEPARLEDQEG